MRTFIILVATLCYACASIDGDFRPEVNRYLRELNSGGLLHTRHKRQSDQSSSLSNYYYVTQCDFNITEKPEGSPSIEVFGKELANPALSLPKAAELIHRMVRFMPRDLFVTLAGNSAVGLFDYTQLPAYVFEEFDDMPNECLASCSSSAYIPSTQETYDCSQWCTSRLYPFYENYPINYLWAYGNFSRTFVVESNVICQGFNPSGGSENYLVREFALTIMTRALGNERMAEITEAYENAVSKSTWIALINVYDYFMKGALVWFNAVADKDISLMNCKFSNNGAVPVCETGYDMRMYLKVNDPQLYSILNKVFNNNREYAQSYTSVCDW